MNYALEVLTKERALIEKALSEWHEQSYPEAKKDRNSKLKNLNKAINTLNRERY